MIYFSGESGCLDNRLGNNLLCLSSSCASVMICSGIVEFSLREEMSCGLKKGFSLNFMLFLANCRSFDDFPTLKSEVYSEYLEFV